MSHWFYCPDLCPDGVPTPVGALIELPDDESAHASRVLRVRAGEAVGLISGRGDIAEAAVVDPGRPVVVSITSLAHHPPVAPALDVAAAVPKGSLVEDMVRQLSQIGATSWQPMSTQRSVVDPRQAKLNRLQRLVVESAKQCGRSHLLRIADIAPFEDIIARDYDVKLICALDEAHQLDAAALSAQLAGAQRVLVLVGPEGGWTDDERSCAVAAGALPIRLGPHVMRIEAAACAAASIVRFLTM